MADFIVDTRNQKDDFVIKSLNKLGHRCERKQLYFGDIALKGEMLNCIDLKSSGGGLIELGHNILSKDHERLKKEIHKCIGYGGKITFLCFEPGITCIDDIEYWQIPTFKSNQYVTSYYSKKTNEKISKVTINQEFAKRVKNNKIILKGTYDEGLNAFIEKYTYQKSILAHKKGEPKTKLNPTTLMKAIRTMCEPNHYAEGFKVNIEFTSSENCGLKITEILLKNT